jgi:hypothetical protein
VAVVGSSGSAGRLMLVAPSQADYMSALFDLPNWLQAGCKAKNGEVD